MSRRLVVAAFAALGAVLVVAGSASARSAVRLEAPISPIDHAGPNYNGGKPLPFAAGTRAKAQRAAKKAAGRPAARALGDRQLWPASDDFVGLAYVKYYTLRAVGEHIEIWVASDQDEISKGLEFPAGDCRNDERTQITDEQLASMVREFDQTMYPRESQTFSVAPDRDGTFAFLPADFGLPADYYAGEGDNTVVLVDNVRDLAFYDAGNSTNSPFTAGFFWSFFNEAVDRNVITIDGYGWLYRTGANPPDRPVAGDFCRSKPARPYSYEGVFAHEYQHLLEYYEDVDEYAWVNEGLSMYAETLTGYTDPTRPITDSRFEGAVQCFLGNSGIQTAANPTPRDGGPENSLTLWGDQGDQEILCDYGAASTLMHLLAGRYGDGFMSQLHADDDNGLSSLRALVRTADSKAAAREILHDWAAMIALDSRLDHDYVLTGGPEARYRSSLLDAGVNWDAADAYQDPGAPPNGSDYVRLRGGSGSYLKASQIRSLSFDGAEELPATPVEWEIDTAAPGQVGDPALYSGSGPNLDRAIVYEVRVPGGNPALTFDTLFDTEPAWDFAFVQVSTDGGATYTSVANDLTTSDADPGADPRVLAGLPGFTGISGGGEEAAWISTTFDLSAYAGQTILVSFRYVTDPYVDLPGWWIDDVKVGDTVLTDGTSLAGGRSPTEIHPTAVAGWTVQLVGYTTAKPRQAFVHRLALNGRFEGRLSGAKLRSVLGGSYDVVAAIVTYDDPTELVTQYAPYTLSVAADDVVQPGGSRVVQPGGRGR